MNTTPEALTAVAVVLALAALVALAWLLVAIARDAMAPEPPARSYQLQPGRALARYQASRPPALHTTAGRSMADAGWGWVTCPC